MIEYRFIPLCNRFLSKKINNFSREINDPQILSSLGLDPQHILQNKIHNRRVVEKWATRFIIREFISETTGQLCTWDQLNITNHHFLSELPDILVSLSHDKELAVNVFADKNDFFSIGVDIESCDRVPTMQNKKITKFYLNSDDDPSIDFFHLWVLKEAIYKSLTPYLMMKKTIAKKVNDGRDLSLPDSTELNMSDIWVEKRVNFGQEYHVFGLIICEATNTQSMRAMPIGCAELKVISSFGKQHYLGVAVIPHETQMKKMPPIA